LVCFWFAFRFGRREGAGLIEILPHIYVSFFTTNKLPPDNTEIKTSDKAIVQPLITRP
jgi:hypothetical protein